MHKKNITTSKHFDLFKKECLRLQKEWKMDDWDIYFEHVKLSGLCGKTSYKATDRNATIALSSDWGDSPTLVNNESVKRTAKHEMIHILLAPIAVLMEARYTTPDEINEAEHRVLTKLLHLL